MTKEAKAKLQAIKVDPDPMSVLRLFSDALWAGGGEAGPPSMSAPSPEDIARVGRWVGRAVARLGRPVDSSKPLTVIVSGGKLWQER